MKVAIIGHMDPGKSCLSEIVRARIEEKGIGSIHISQEEAHDRGIRMGNVVIDELKSMRGITPRMLELPFTPPLTRRERRKLNRKKK